MPAPHSRLLLSSEDLSEAIGYMEALATPGADAWPDTVRRALKVAAVVAYARPFSGNRNEAGRKERVAIDDYVTDAQALVLHAQAIVLRDTLLAHSDFSAKPNTDPMTAPSGVVTYSFTLRDPLDEPLDLFALLTIARSIREAMDKQREIVISLSKDFP